MKRDLDLVRAILITAESSDGPVGEAVLLSLDSDADKIAYHLELMCARGLVVADVSYDGFGRTPIDMELLSLTWEGYDYLDAIRSAKVWSKAKESMTAAIGDVSLSLAKETCLMVARQLIAKQIS